jgi:Tfp pilus assembly protein PilF
VFLLRKRAAAYAGKGDMPRAIANYDKAIESMPNLFEAYNERADAYSTIGDAVRAKADYAKAIELESKPR